MDLLLGLPGVVVTKVHETFEAVTCFVNVIGPKPSCKKCGASSGLVAHGAYPFRVRDTPMRGQPTVLVMSRKRFKCRCGATTVEELPFADKGYSRLSDRLARYIENQAFRRPISHVAAEVGVREPVVREIVASLAERLWTHHRFPTPTVFGIDDLRIRGKLLTVLTDGRTGHAIGLVEGGKELKIRREMVRRQIDQFKVQIVVSDLAPTNIAVVAHYFDKSPVIHVADKWHVLKGVQEALSLVINQHIDRWRRRRALWEKRLKRKGWVELKVDDRIVTRRLVLHPMQKFQDRIATLRDHKKHLMGARVELDPTGQLQLFPRALTVGPTVKTYPRIGKAFFTKIRLHKVYARQSRAQADHDIDLFLLRAASPSIKKEMSKIVERVKTHRNLILNYYNALATNAPGVLAIPTNGPTERRNGIIRAAWRSSRGIKSHELLTLRALYEPWHIDVDIALCTGEDPDGKPCKVVEGPFAGQQQARRARTKPALHRHRCPDCP